MKRKRSQDQTLDYAVLIASPSHRSHLQPYLRAGKNVTASPYELVAGVDSPLIQMTILKTAYRMPVSPGSCLMIFLILRDRGSFSRSSRKGFTQIQDIFQPDNASSDLWTPSASNSSGSNNTKTEWWDKNHKLFKCKTVINSEIENSVDISLRQTSNQWASVHQRSS